MKKIVKEGLTFCEKGGILSECVKTHENKQSIHSHLTAIGLVSVNIF